MLVSLGVYGVFTGLVLFETKENKSDAKKEINYTKMYRCVISLATDVRLPLVTLNSIFNTRYRIELIFLCRFEVSPLVIPKVMYILLKVVCLSVISRKK